MPAYVRLTTAEFIEQPSLSMIGSLQRAYADDGFVSQYTRQTKAWSQLIPRLKDVLSEVSRRRPQARTWTVLLEYPLYRLRRRIDIVLLIGPCIVVIECKVGARKFTSEDRRQVEEYALDLRDFHAESRCRQIYPFLWTTEPQIEQDEGVQRSPSSAHVATVRQLAGSSLAECLLQIPASSEQADIIPEAWDQSRYRPVPTVIEAATSIFSGHDVRSIANADADNLKSAGMRILTLIEQARLNRQRYLVFLTGVPGSGKTLAGLHVVHAAVATGKENQGDIVYLSGNTPLVVVLREALAKDEHSRQKQTGPPKTLREIRGAVRARIQHINDFLQESLRVADRPPHEHVIVFDEAQRAWDEKRGLDKFDRTASEPSLLLDLMSRHADWCACVCLIGSGQEINSGENGLLGWGDALRTMAPDGRKHWWVFGPTDILPGSSLEEHLTLGVVPEDVRAVADSELQLRVPQRSYRSPCVSTWVDRVLAGNREAAREIAGELSEYPIVITRSLVRAKSWLREHGRGERRYGLIASSGARRLRADGLGTLLDATAGDEIAHWYLNPYGDIRSSYALELPANEYACQGLELDFACLCWGGDFLWEGVSRAWTFHRLSGTSWNRVSRSDAQRYTVNSYRVLLTRAREGLVIWIPRGDASDGTRREEPLDRTAEFIEACGATPLCDA